MLDKPLQFSTCGGIDSRCLHHRTKERPLAKSEGPFLLFSGSDSGNPSASGTDGATENSGRTPHARDAASACKRKPMG